MSCRAGGSPCDALCTAPAASFEQTAPRTFWARSGGQAVDTKSVSSSDAISWAALYCVVQSGHLSEPSPHQRLNSHHRLGGCSNSRHPAPDPPALIMAISCVAQWSGPRARPTSNSRPCASASPGCPPCQ
jgi:hypothetical protein